MADTTGRPRVRVLVHGAERSGPPIYVLRLLRSWAAAPPPFRAEVVLARPGELVEEFASVAPTSVARLDRRAPERLAQRSLRAARLETAGRRLMDAAVHVRVRGDDPDLTIVNGATAATVELLRALDPRGSVVTVAHELSTGWYSNLSADDRALLLSRSTAFLAVSGSVRSFLVGRLGVDPQAVTVLPPPVDLAGLGRSVGRIDGPVDRGTQTVAGCGMTDWRKAPELWLRVAAAVRRQPGHHHVRFVWAGGDDATSAAFWPLEHEMRHLGLRDDVEFLGQVEEPWRALGDAALLVSTAREDAYPLACAEAICAGIPVVGFDVDGIGEMVRESGCGVVVPYPDEAAIADAVGRLLGDEPARQEMAAAGVEFGRAVLDVTRIAPQVADWVMEQAA